MHHEQATYNASNGFVTNIEKDTLENDNYRKVLFTATREQLVLMSIPPGGDVGEEVHPAVDQFIRIEAGEGKAVLDGQEFPIEDGSAIVVPAGTRHNFVNVSGKDDMKLYTVYSPPNHPPGTIEATKADAEEQEPEPENEMYEQDEGMADIHTRIKSFFRSNPSPSDKQVHDLADELGIDPDKLEEHIYMILSSLLKKEE